MAHAYQTLPTDFDARDLNFPRDLLQWSQRTISEMHQTVIATYLTIASSRAAMIEADRILARSFPAGQGDG